MLNVVIANLVTAILPIFGSILMAAVSYVMLQLREKYHVQTTIEMKDAVHSALFNALKTLLTEHVIAGKPIGTFNSRSAITAAVAMVLKSNGGQIAKLGMPEGIMSRVAASKLPDAIVSTGLVTDQDAIKTIISPSGN